MYLNHCQDGLLQPETSSLSMFICLGSVESLFLDDGEGGILEAPSQKHSRKRVRRRDEKLISERTAYLVTATKNVASINLVVDIWHVWQPSTLAAHVTVVCGGQITAHPDTWMESRVHTGVPLTASCSV